MGTNYYLHRETCPCCHREKGEPLHIGKAGMTIKNEYNETITADAFWQIVESMRHAALNHTTYVRNSPEYREHAKNYWLDDKGNSFTGTEFS